MSLSSDEEGPPLQEPAPKIARWQAKPSLNEQWFQHPSSKIIHAAPVHDPEATRISVCGRITKSPFREVTEAAEWTYKCRICFAGKAACAYVMYKQPRELQGHAGSMPSKKNASALSAQLLQSQLTCPT